MGHISTAGTWHPSQQVLHINLLELEAVVLALKEFLPEVQGKHVLVHTDNTTVLYYLNRQGGGALSIPIGEGRTASPLVPRAEYHSDSEAHFRETECSSGPIEQSSYSPTHGVDFGQERSPSSLGDLVHPTSGPLRNKVQ